ncbi:MAG: hypothetical protein O3B95_05270 [Chloroflexi bacterium]|nr:hypothetical protein [Chloroflexota bacterium]
MRRGIAELSVVGFESALEQVLSDRSQTVLAPRRPFERIENLLGDQERRSLLQFTTGFLLTLNPSRRQAIALFIPLAAVLVIAIIASFSGVLERNNVRVADEGNLLRTYGPPRGDDFGVNQVPWTVAAGMNNPRQRHGSVSLHDGRVLVFGGFDASGPVLTTEIYDPELDMWTTVGNFPYELPNFNPPVVLRDGRVLVVGGSRAQKPDAMFTWYLRDSALFDPETGEWKPVDDILSFGRRNANTVLLPDGRTLLYGGTANRIIGFEQHEVFDPRTVKWARTTDVSDLPEHYLAWSEIEDMNVITVILDSQIKTPTAPSEILPGDMVISLNPDTRWIPLVDNSVNFGSPFISELSNGRLLIGTGSLEFGGSGQAYFVDRDGQVSRLPAPSGLQADNREIRVLATSDGYVGAVAERWQVPVAHNRPAMRTLRDERSTWTLIGTFPSPGLEEFSVTMLGENRVLITGGSTGEVHYSDASYILQLPSE